MFGSKMRKIEALERNAIAILNEKNRWVQKHREMEALASNRTEALAAVTAERDMGLQRVTELELELADAKRGAEEVRRELDDAYKQVGKEHGNTATTISMSDVERAKQAASNNDPDWR